MAVRLRAGCVALSVLALCAVPAHAQEAVNTSTVSGRIVDPQGSVVPGATVTAREIDTNVTRETTTGTDGRFRFAFLRVGRYELTVHLDAFADATRRLTLTVGSAFDLLIPLSVSSVESRVDVSADATVIEASRSQIA